MHVAVIRDLVGVSGAISIAYGAWLAYPPAGFIVGGALAIAAAWLHGRISSDPAEGDEAE